MAVLNVVLYLVKAIKQLNKNMIILPPIPIITT